MSEDVTVTVESLSEIVAGRKRCLAELAFISALPPEAATHKGGIELGLQDWLREECVLLQELKNRLTEAEWKQLLFGGLKEIQNGDPVGCRNE